MEGIIEGDGVQDPRHLGSTCTDPCAGTAAAAGLPYDRRLEGLPGMGLPERCHTRSCG